MYRTEHISHVNTLQWMHSYPAYVCIHPFIRMSQCVLTLQMKPGTRTTQSSAHVLNLTGELLRTCIKKNQVFIVHGFYVNSL